MDPAVTTTAPDPAATTPPTSGVPERRDFFTRSCDSRIGVGYDTENAEVPILFVGPIASLGVDFWWTANETHYLFEEVTPEGGYEAIKLAANIDGTAEGSVTLTIPTATLSVSPTIPQGLATRRWPKPITP